MGFDAAPRFPARCPWRPVTGAGLRRGNARRVLVWIRVCSKQWPDAFL